MEIFHFRIPSTLLLSANRELHWAPKAQRKADLRRLGQAKGLKRGVRLNAPVTLAIHLGYPDARRRDAENYAPTVKALIDGLVGDAHLLSGDDDAVIVSRTWTSEITRQGCTEVWLTFKEKP